MVFLSCLQSWARRRNWRRTPGLGIINAWLCYNLHFSFQFLQIILLPFEFFLSLERNGFLVLLPATGSHFLTNRGWIKRWRALLCGAKKPRLIHEAPPKIRTETISHMLESQRRKGHIMNGFQKRRLLEGNSCKHLEEPNIGLLLECRNLNFFDF